MFKPTRSLHARYRLTTKAVNGGYYKGNRTGSMGAHTEYGGYVIDYRKLRTFVCPDLQDFVLTPFVTKQMEPTKFEKYLDDGTTVEPKRVDGMDFLNLLRDSNPEEYEGLQQADSENPDSSTANQEGAQFEGSSSQNQNRP